MLLLALLVALLAASCQQPERASSIHHRLTDDSAGSPLRQQREISMNEHWQNRRLSELVAAMGQPSLLMSIPGGGNPPGFVAVFGVDEASGCIDAFALFHGPDPIIRIYHCR